MRLVGVSGSLRSGSFNAALLRAAAELAPSEVELSLATIQGVPLYDCDLEAAEGMPPAASTLKEAIASADGVLLVTPEYNSGVPGVFKNAVDWTTRPSSDIPRVWGGRPVAVIGASQGGFGTILSQHAWLPILKKLGAATWNGGSLMVSRASGAFDADGRLTDDKVRDQLRQFLAGFATFVATNRK